MESQDSIARFSCLVAPQQAIAADRDREGFRFAGKVVVGPPLIHSLWSWRPVMVTWSALHGSRMAGRWAAALTSRGG